MKRHRTKKNTYWRPKGQFCNPDDVFRQNMWREIGQRGTSHSLGWFGLFFVAKNVIPNTPHLNSNRKKTNKYRRIQGQFCNTDDVFRAKMWREIAKQNEKKTAFFAIPPGRYRTQFGLFFEEKSDSEHPKTQQRDRKIGQTIGSPMRTFGESWGASGEPFGETWGRLWGDSESVFLTKHA